MHFYEITNSGTAPYVVQDATGHAQRIQPGTNPQKIPLGDSTAIALKQTELRGGKLKITPASPEAEEVLRDVAAKPGRAFRIVPPSPTAPQDQAPPKPHKSQARIERDLARAEAEDRAELARIAPATPPKVVLQGRRVGDRTGTGENRENVPAQKRATAPTTLSPVSEGRPRVAKKGK